MHSTQAAEGGGACQRQCVLMEGSARGRFGRARAVKSATIDQPMTVTESAAGTVISQYAIPIDDMECS